MPTKLLHRMTTHYSSGGVRKRKRAVKGGAQLGKAQPFQSYALPDGASDQRGAALESQKAMDAKQQGLVSAHGQGGGRRKRRMTRRKTKNNRKKNIRRKKTMRRKGKKRSMRKKKKNVRRTRRRTRRRIRRGGANVDGPGCAVPSDPVTVPSFAPPSGNHVGPSNSDTASQGGNSTHMQANADACNDHYATSGGRRRTSRRMKGGFQNWRDHFGGFGEKMTGGKSRKKYSVGGEREQQQGSSQELELEGRLEDLILQIEAETGRMQALQEAGTPIPPEQIERVSHMAAAANALMEAIQQHGGRKKKAGARIWKSCMSGGKNRPFDLSPRDITGAGRGHDGSGTWEKFQN